MSNTLPELIGGFVFGSAAWLIASRIYYALHPQRRRMNGNPTSLIDRLRAYPQTARNAPPCHEAADEIIRLSAQLGEVLNAGDNLYTAIRDHYLTEQHLKAWEEARRGKPHGFYSWDQA